MVDKEIEQLRPELESPEESDVGARLRALRQRRALSQRELARVAGVTNGTISMIENNQISPSVGSLKKLTEALSVSLAEFFSTDWRSPAGPFFAKDQLLEIGGGEVSLRLVPAGVGEAKLQVLHERYPPGSDTGPELLSHQGEEAGVVVKGSVRVTVGGQERLLSEGDAYYFDSRIPHRFRNDSDELCELVSAANPGTF